MLTRTYAARGRVYCSGSGTSTPIRMLRPRADGLPHCMVLIRADKPSGLCNFCERTERS